jgi:hypothetical protein
MTEFGIKRRQADKYLALARAEIMKDNDIDRPDRRACLRKTFESILEEARDNSDGRTEVGAARELSKLDGVAEPETTRHEISGVLGIGVAIEPDPVVALQRLEELRKKQGR